MCYSSVPWNLSIRYIHCTGQFTPKMKANAEPHLLSSLVWIDSGVVVSQYRLESFFIKWNVSEWQVSRNSWEEDIQGNWYEVTWAGSQIHPTTGSMTNVHWCQTILVVKDPVDNVLHRLCIFLCKARPCPRLGVKQWTYHWPLMTVQSIARRGTELVLQHKWI